MANTPTSRSRANLSFTDVLRYAASYWARQPRKLAIMLAIVVVASLLETYLPSALAGFLEAIRKHDTKREVLQGLYVFLGTYVAQVSLFSIAYIIYNSFEVRLFKDVVDDAFQYIYRLPEYFFVNTFTGSIISKITRARHKIEVFEDQVFFRIFPTIIVLIGSIIFLAMRFPMLALLMMLYLGTLVAVSALLVFKISGPAQNRYANAQDTFSAHLADSISGVITTKSYAQESYEIEKFSATITELARRNLRAYQLSNLSGAIQRFLLAGMLVLLMGGGTWYYFHGMASIESMAYLVLAYNIMQGYIRDVGENIKNLLTSSYDLHAIIHLLNEKPEINKAITYLPLNIKQGGIIFDNVTFTYPDKVSPIFEKLSVNIKPGERIALVGHSGGGKTTFIRLLQHLYDIQGGEIRIDGQPIIQATRQSLRSSMALVPQDPMLFHRTLRENIAYAKPNATMTEVSNAAKQAHIEEFILSLPEKYETLVGERGVKLSGGERQRIAIARAILANRPILIFDEATSSLDSASEKAIQEALHSLTHGRTSIMIAHRLSTILDADRILVFDAGQIVEEGTHAELVGRKDGIYAGLFKLQSGGFLPD